MSAKTSTGSLPLRHPRGWRWLSGDKSYLQKRRVGERRSSMKFPREEVTVPEMELWCCAIAQVVSHGPAQASLGVFRVDGSNCGSGE